MTKSQSSISPGCQLEGFLISRVVPLPQVRGRAVEAVHRVTGARLLHLHTDDEENLFSIAFRTPPPDDTGVPHILEHAVLGGSRRFPVKDPFVEMLKRSMATFLNAMTDSDATYYPAASNVREDYFNLVGVYCDAVLHPRITLQTLRQEGHHLALTKPENPASSSLRINGIVYNEMKGVYSNVDSYHQRMVDKHLFPDSPYGRDSGGDPAAIPDLGYQQFIDFYRRFYHPSNARIFICGDIPTLDHLAYLEPLLRDCPPLSVEPDSSIPAQPPWQRSRRVRQAYPADPEADPSKDSLVSVNWLVGDCSDPLVDLAMHLLSRLLLGHASAPLHKALIDSHLGKGLTPSGYHGGVFETTFQVGLKGVSEECTESVEALILQTLQTTVEEGFDAERLAVAFHQMQYSQREINRNYSLKLMFWAYNYWNWDLDPLTGYQTSETLDRLAKKIKKDPKWLTDLLAARLLHNRHRLTMTLVPDCDMQRRNDQELADKLAATKARMSEAEIIKIKEDAACFAEQQKRPNSPAELATLPQLPVSAIPDQPREIPCQISQPQQDVVFIHNHLFTNQINYLRIGFDLSDLPDDMWLWLPLFCMLFSQLGTARANYEVMARRIAGAAATLQADIFTATSASDSEQLNTQFTVDLVALDQTLPQALALAEELLLSLDFSDRQRLRDVIEQAREQWIGAVVPNGHRLAALHAARSISPLAALAEQTSGMPQGRLLNRLSLEFDRLADQMVERLEAIQKHLQRRRPLTVSFSGGSAQAEQVVAWSEKLHRQMTPGQFRSGQRGCPVALPDAAGSLEGLAFMADVAYCAVCLPAPAFDDPRSVPLKLLAQILNYDYMWENVRVRGGAYGAGCVYDPGLTLLRLVSSQDPDIVSTINTCSALPDYLESFRLDSEILDRARIACAKYNQRPLRPASATQLSFARYLCELTPEIRRRRRRQLLTVSPEEVRQTGLDVLRAGMQQSRSCVLSSRQRLEQAGRQLSEHIQIESLLPAADNPVLK